MQMMVLNDIVMGLHWTPPAQHRGARLEAANLDAVCVLLDGNGRQLEVIRPGHLKGANGSVVHTGDSRTGASAWDDERIFVFVDALPAYVDSLVLGVISHDRPFSEVAGASCHISDVRLEDELLRIQLTPLGPVTEYCIATVQRCAFGWIMRQRAPGGARLGEVLSLPPSRDVEASYRSEAAASACAAAQPGVL
jgi:stress response protein SCP2